MAASGTPQRPVRFSADGKRPDLVEHYAREGAIPYSVALILSFRVRQITDQGPRHAGCATMRNTGEHIHRQTRRAIPHLKRFASRDVS
jgi:hypothetical protein